MDCRYVVPKRARAIGKNVNAREPADAAGLIFLGAVPAAAAQYLTKKRSPLTIQKNSVWNIVIRRKNCFL